MLTQAFINHFQPITDNIDKMAKRVYRLLLDKCMQFFAMSYLYWLIYEQSHLYSQNMSSFCMYTAPKSLQKTPVWIIMRTLLVAFTLFYTFTRLHSFTRSL